MFDNAENVAMRVARLQLVSASNRSRWARFFEPAIGAGSLDIPCRVKCLFDDVASGWGQVMVPNPSHIESSVDDASLYAHGVLHLRAVQWIEFRSPAVDARRELLVWARRCGIPAVMVAADAVRVYGYLAPEDQALLNDASDSEREERSPAS